MKRYGLTALAALALIVVGAAGVYADQTCTSDQYCTSTSCCPSMAGCKWVIMYNPATTSGAGPGGNAQGTPVLVCPAPCCPADNARSCGAFCTSGQVAPGWQYGWCDEYWLRPDSNL